jgi:hypothetical protein
MIQSLDHLIDDQPHGLSIQLSTRRLLEYIEKGLLHQLKDHKDMHSRSLLVGFLIDARNLCLSTLLKTVQQFDDIWVSMKEL